MANPYLPNWEYIPDGRTDFFTTERKNHAVIIIPTSAYCFSVYADYFVLGNIAYASCPIHKAFFEPVGFDDCKNPLKCIIGRHAVFKLQIKFPAKHIHL